VKILFIGDIVGEPRRRAVKLLLPGLRRQHAVDFVIANGENFYGGVRLNVANAVSAQNYHLGEYTAAKGIRRAKSNPSGNSG
jgi:calcineurin-like phosphoesterase